MRKPPPQPGPTAILAALETEATTMERYLAELSQDDLARPSACAGWTNADVVAHLTWAAGLYGEILERALRGDLQPPEIGPPGRDRRQLIAELARELRAELGGSLRESFQHANRSLGAAFVRVGPEDWERPTAHRMGSVRRVVQSRLNELAVHGWDIRSRLDPPGHLLDSSLPVLVDLIGLWFERLFTPNPAQAPTWRLRFDYPAGDIASRDLVIGPSEISFEPASGGPADLVLSGPPEVTVLLAMGRIDPAEAAESYGLRTSGQTDRLELLRSRFGSV